MRFKCNARRDFVFNIDSRINLSIRYSENETLLRLEQIADVIFVAAPVAITLVTTLFAYEVI